ncbi:hypothetical protein [Deminuibacter soli]|uniref:Type VI secretion system baseplate subunit TssK n=1 Tax=Deminuibacter soli TaxID=2291815 RepID=A0A3E1NCC2_9BACT|nr:hypothetical protein [Deminuibacter soli]RFM25603.1 hypothetical protein DXN05_24305 [Deminuibacter soli]
MLFPVKHHAVNWIDGMKISRQHFIDTDKHVADSLRDTASAFLHNYDYGLLPPFRGNRLASDFEISERVTGQIEIRLRQCNAITAGGCRIDLPLLEYGHQLIHQFTSDDTASQEDPAAVAYYYVVLSVNPFDKVPAGDPDPAEMPPRHPYAAKQYQLMVVPAAQINSGELGVHHLVIGQLNKQYGRFSVSEQYIPPCAAITSHPELIRYYERFSALLNDIQLNSFKIIDKITSRDTIQSLAKNVRLLCEHMLNFIAQVFYTYRNVAHQQPPVVVAGYFSNLAHIFYTTLHYSGAREKEELLKYFYEWKDVTPGNFEELLARTIDLVYDHHQIQQSMDQIAHFLQVLAALWSKLSSLEFIGQRRENIVVAEQQVVQQTQARRTWTLLD